MFAYKITNTVNGKAYIGITTRTVEKRWALHVYVAKRGIGRGSKAKFSCAIRKYGPDAFTVETLVTLPPGATIPELYALERTLIAEHGTYRHGYNSTLGGDGILGLKFKQTPEWKAKIGAANRGKTKTAAQRAKHSEINKAAWTPEMRAAAAERATKRQCVRGHSYAGENLYLKPNGTRGCRECRRISKKNQSPEAHAREMELQRIRRAKAAAHEQAQHQGDGGCLGRGEPEGMGARPHQYAWSF